MQCGNGGPACSVAPDFIRATVAARANRAFARQVPVVHDAFGAALEQEMPIVRISLGRFDADKHDVIRDLLHDSQKTLIPAIRALKGNRAYYAGIDRENNAMTNVSVWDTRGDAEQMASLKAMLDLAKVFVDAGVRFERPITNHETLWSM
jgi:hypothetical protein